MIDFYTWHTPNGFKISILLEELKWDYKLFEVDITKDQQFSSDFIKISPNNKIPALIDWDGPVLPLAFFFLFLSQGPSRPRLGTLSALGCWTSSIRTVVRRVPNIRRRNSKARYRHSSGASHR